MAHEVIVMACVGLPAAFALFQWCRSTWLSRMRHQQYTRHLPTILLRSCLQPVSQQHRSPAAAHQVYQAD